MKPKRWKKLLLYTAVGIIFLLLFLYIARPLYLSDTYLIKRLQEVVSFATDYNLNIERGRISLHSGAFLEGVTLEDSERAITVTLKELRVSYRLLSSLKKGLVIKDLVLVDPTIEINKGEVQPDTLPEGALHVSKQGIPDSVAVPTSTPKKPLESTIEFALPIAVEIENLQVQNATLKYLKQNTGDSFETSMTGINVTGKDIYLHEEENSHAQVTIVVNDSLRLRYAASNTYLDCRSEIEFSANAAVRLVHSSVDFSFSAKPQVKTTSTKALFPEVKVSAEVRLEALQNMEVPEICLSLGNAVAMAAAVKIQDVFQTPAFQAELKESRVDLEAVFLVLDDLSGLFPRVSFAELPRLSGRLLLQESQFYGIIGEPDPELKGTLRCRLENGFLQDPKVGFSVSNVTIDAFVEGQFYPPQQFYCDMGIDMVADSVQAPGQSLAVSPLSLGISAEVQPGMMLPELSMVWVGGTSFGGELKGSVFCTAEKLDLQNPQLSPNILLEAGCSVDDIDLKELFPNEIDGLLSLACDLNIRGLDDIALSIGSFCPDLRLKHPVGDVAVPPLMTRIEMRGSTDPDFHAFNVPEVHVDLSPYGKIDLSASLHENQIWDVKNADLDADLGEVLAVMRPLLPDPAKDIVVGGKIALSGSCQGRGNVIDEFQPDFRINSDGLFLSSQQQGVAVDSVRVQVDMKGNRRNLEVSGDAVIKRLSLSRYNSEPYKNVAVDASGRFRNFRDFTGGSVNVRFEDLGLGVRIDPQPSMSDRSPLGDIDIKYRFESADSVRLLQNLLVSGWSDGEGTITFPADTITRLEGVLTGRDLELKNRQDFSISGLSFYLPFKTELNTGAQEISLISDEQSPSPLDDQVLFNSFGHLVSPESGLGTVACENIQVGDYEFSNLEGLLSFQQGQLRVPSLNLEAYGGTIQSAFAIKSRSLDPDTVEYWMKITGVGLNSARLPAARSVEGEESEISAFAHIKGQGLDPNSRFSLEGGLDITRIGRKVADNILRFLDPEQTDPSIQTYRRYIKRGWGVKVFSFDVKEDFVYVSITPARPPITQLDMFLLSHLVGLGKSITFGRLPLRYFLGQSQQE